MIKKETVYKIGKIGKPHGVNGEVAFHFDDDVFDRTEAQYLILEIDGILVPFFIDEYRFKTDETALVLFADIDTQDKAATSPAATSTSRASIATPMPNRCRGLP